MLTWNMTWQSLKDFTKSMSTFFETNSSIWLYKDSHTFKLIQFQTYSRTFPDSIFFQTCLRNAIIIVQSHSIWKTKEGEFWRQMFDLLTFSNLSRYSSIECQAWKMCFWNSLHFPNHGNPVLKVFKELISVFKICGTNFFPQ